MGARHNPYFRKLLVGFDASPQAERAVEVAMQLSQCLDAEIVLFAVAWLPKPATRVEVHAILDDAREHYTAAFEKLASSAKDHGLNMKTEIVVGDPAGQIIHRAEAGGRGLAHFSAYGGNHAGGDGRTPAHHPRLCGTATFMSRTSTCRQHRRPNGWHRTSWSTPFCRQVFCRRQT